MALRPRCAALRAGSGRTLEMFARPGVLGASLGHGEFYQGLPHSARMLHTSVALLSRRSFVKTITDKVNRLRSDPNIQNKVMGVGATGYAVTKVAKMGAVAKFALPALKLAKAMPLMSMGLTTVCYTCFFGFPFAIGIVGVLASSNAARNLLLKRYGCEVTAATMIPFLGTMNSGPKDYSKSEEYVLLDQPFKRCLVALAPVAGMFAFTAAGPFGAAGVAYGSQCGFAVANTGFMMGMFSLLPLGSMTPGGQLLDYFSKHALLYGTAFNAALLTVFSNPILYLCFFLNLYKIYQRGFMVFGRQIGGDTEATFNDVARALTIQTFTDKEKMVVAGLYWSLFLMNAGGMMLVGNSLRSPQELRQEQVVEERERRLADPIQPGDGRFSSPPPSDMGGFGIADWAMGNLQSLEALESEDDRSMDWWEQQQIEAAQLAQAEQTRVWR